MTNYLHPPFSAFPLVIILLIAIIETINAFKPLLSNDKLSLYLTYSLFVFTFLTYISGHFAALTAHQSFQVPEQKIAFHQLMGKASLFSEISLIVFNHLKNDKLILKLFYYAILFITAILIMSTSYLGGELVFKFGAGVLA